MTNKAFFVGNVGGDPELRYTQKGSAVVEFSLAIQKGYKDESGNWQEKDPVWLTVKAWQGLAENVAETVTTGMRVVVIGKLDVETWEAEDGGKRSKVVIVADEVSPSLRWATASVTKQAKAAS